MAAPMTAAPAPAPVAPAPPPVDAAEAARRASAVSMALHGTLGPEQPQAAPAAPQTPQAAAVSQALGRGSQIGATAPVQDYAANQAAQQYTWADKQRSADNAGTQSLLGAINTSTDNYLKQIAAAQPMDQRRNDALVKQAELDFQDKAAERGTRNKELAVRNKAADAALAAAGVAAGLKPIPVDTAAKQSGIKPDALKSFMGKPDYASLLDQTIGKKDKGWSQAEYNAWVDGLTKNAQPLMDADGKFITDSQGKAVLGDILTPDEASFLKIRYGPLLAEYSASGTGVQPPQPPAPVGAPPSTKSNLPINEQNWLRLMAANGIPLPPGGFSAATPEAKVAAVMAANKKKSKNSPK